MASVSDTRTVSLVDLPLVRRLSDNGVMLHSEIGLTQDARGQNTALLSRMLFQRGLYTLVARSDERLVLGQFRYDADDLNAHMVYLAPRLEAHHDNTVWLNILDAMATEAGKHGAHALIAEVEPDSYLFQTMRNAGYSVYMRQYIWRHNPVELESSLVLTEETANDQMNILSLVNSTIPHFLQQVAAPSGDGTGYIYRENGRMEAYIAVSEGKQGLYLMPYIDANVLEKASDILTAAISQISRSRKVPIYVAVRSYQDWLATALERLDFEYWLEQAVMVKHLAARVHQKGFKPLSLQQAVEGARRICPPTRSIIVKQQLEEQPDLYGTSYHRQY